MSASDLPPASASTAIAWRDAGWRDAWIALLLAIGCYAVSCAIVPPGTEAKGFGIQWELMSQDPLRLTGQFPHRLLVPTLAWLAGFGGVHFLLFVRGLAILLLATVCWFARRRGLGWLDATLVATAVALTAPVQLYKDHWVGYADPLCYALFLLMPLCAHRPALFWSLFGVNLLNHELAVFLLPWLWFLRREAGGRIGPDLLGAGVALGGYAAFYLLVKSLAEPLFTYEYFASHPLFPGGTLVVWSLMLVHLVVAYGPVLAVLAWHQHVSLHGRERWHLWLVLGGVLVIFCIAFDWARHSNLLLVPLVIASVRFLQAGQRPAFVALLALGVALMLWIPPWAPTAWPTSTMASPQLLVQSGVAILHPPRFPGDFNVTFGPLSAALQGWLPQVWKSLLVIAALLAGIWAAGAGLARRRVAATAHGPGAGRRAEPLDSVS